MKRRFTLLCVLLLLLGGLPGCGVRGSVTVCDAQGTPMGTPEKMAFSSDRLEEEAYGSYVELVLTEAVAILSDLYDYEEEQAQEALFRDGYTIHTAFDPAVFAAIETTYAEHAPEDLDFGCAITDYAGNLCAVYSQGETNYAITPQSPHSAFKPLSVYAPAMEEGLISWSTFFTDMPYKQLTDGNGRKTDWPVNPSGGYTYARTSLYECVRQSLNTAAVHCLAKVGVPRSVAFLTNAFGMDLAYEQSKLAVEGEEEVIGNIALGSLYKGVSPVDMAGYYQIFGNAGRYEAPHTITKLCDKDGTAVYTYAGQPKQILQPETADIMNRLLQGVVQPGGTGAAARVDGVTVAGKTGTGDIDEGNWFVGVTPQYSGAVWHGNNEDGNVAAALFGQIFTAMPAHTQTEFPSCPGVRKGVFCSQSGLLFSSECSKMTIGYYASDRKPAACDKH